MASSERPGRALRPDIADEGHPIHAGVHSHEHWQEGHYHFHEHHGEADHTHHGDATSGHVHEREVEAEEREEHYHPVSPAARMRQARAITAFADRAKGIDFRSVL